MCTSVVLVLRNADVITIMCCKLALSNEVSDRCRKSNSLLDRIWKRNQQITLRIYSHIRNKGNMRSGFVICISMMLFHNRAWYLEKDLNLHYSHGFMLTTVRISNLGLLGMLKLHQLLPLCQCMTLDHLIWLSYNWFKTLYLLTFFSFSLNLVMHISWVWFFINKQQRYDYFSFRFKF